MIDVNSRILRYDVKERMIENAAESGNDVDDKKKWHRKMGKTYKDS